MSDRITRHALIDRLFHWITAACVLTLLATAFLPILGVEFGWVTPHWITGLVMLAAVLFHIVRALIWQRLSTIWIGLRDLRDGWQVLRHTLGAGGGDDPKPGKYSLSQKGMHHALSICVLAVIVTGLLMMVRIDTPFWERNPYWLSASTWGIVYVVHGFAALIMITLIMLHIYFALRPEKLLYTRAMIRGWITKDEQQEHHDLTRWQ